MEFPILSEGFKITIKGLSLIVGGQFHIYSEETDYGLYKVLSKQGDTYTTSTRMPTLQGNYTISPIQTNEPKA